MPDIDEASAGAPQPQLHIKETYFQTPKAVHPPNAAPKKVISSTACSVLAPSMPRRDSKHEPSTEHMMGYNPAIISTTVTFEENKTLNKRFNTMFCSAWRAFRKCICSPSLTELDDVDSSTARLLHADRHQPIYGYGSIAGGVKPTIPSNNASSRSDNAWSRPQRGRLPQHGPEARPTPNKNFIG